MTYAQIASQLGMARTTVFRWSSEEPVRSAPTAPCPRCDYAEIVVPAPSQYLYLLGQYLGDGHLATSARVPVLRIYACADYPDTTREIDSAIAAVRGRAPGHVFGPARSTHVLTVQSYWKHWPYVFPQHGPGRKHERPIVLAPWQQKIVDANPWPLIRGLVHSDGCRSINSVTVHGKRYSYPRYFFNNKSRDILGIFTAALDQVGVEWKYNRWDSVSVANGARSLSSIGTSVRSGDDQAQSTTRTNLQPWLNT